MRLLATRARTSTDRSPDAMPPCAVAASTQFGRKPIGSESSLAGVALATKRLK
jgi:hypothetical protein